MATPTAAPHPDRRAPADTLAAISEANVREALRAMRFAKPLTPSPLLALALVDVARSAEGLEDTSETRVWLLQRLFSEAILAGLARVRGVAEIDAATLSPIGFAAGMAEDYRGGEIDREAWSMLALRHVVDDRIGNPELAERLLVTKRTLIRRLGRGYALLADVLRERELDALRARSAAGGAYSRGVTDQDEAGEASSSGEGRGATRPGAATGATGGPSPGREEPHPDLETLRDALAAGRDLTDLPVDLKARAARHTPANLEEQRLVRLATWLAPRYQIDTRFVALTLLIDRGEATSAGRWQARPRRYDGLADVLADAPDPALVVLGAPGAGKSTLLRRLELDTCLAALRGAHDQRVTFHASLSGFVSDPGEPLPTPRAWLGRLWAQRHPRLPSLDDLLAEGRVLLLLDGLNEMPHDGPVAYRSRVVAWKRFVQESLSGSANRAVFSCRSLDYSAPLSTPELRVPQVRIEPLDDEGMIAFVAAYGGEEAWKRIEGSPHRDLMRTPYLLRLLLAALASAEEATPLGPAALLTAFVRRALRREVERDHPALVSGVVLSERDVRRIVGADRWRTPYELPGRGPLIDGLERLAHGMQSSQPAEDRRAVQVLYDEALDLIEGEDPETVVQAGLALAVLDEDRDRDELLFFHQLIQEYFAARRLAERGEVERAGAAWRADEVQPSLVESLDGLGIGEPLPPLPDTAWSESARMAAAMLARPADFVAALAEHNLVLAARAALVPEVAVKIPDGTRDALRAALVERSRDPAADLRARFAAGRVLGRLGDPRFERREGAHGDYLLPPLVEIAGGGYTIGDDAMIEWQGIHYGGHSPAHPLALEPFSIGRYAVTNAEWACFMDAGGYEEESWWQGEPARAWRLGEGTDEEGRENNRAWRRNFQENPSRIEHFLAVGTLDEPTAERWQRWCALDDDAFEAELAARWPGGKVSEPRFWSDRRYNRPSDPVVGISWFEARAYCAWLAVTSGLAFRLPSEVEWEAAARGKGGRRLPYGEHYIPLAANTVDAHLFGPSPIGIFPEGDTPEGVCDLSGNTWDWTASAWGLPQQTEDSSHSDFAYPYDSADGREDPELPPDIARVARGGAWNGPPVGGYAVNRNNKGPRHRADDVGLRVVVGSRG